VSLPISRCNGHEAGGSTYQEDVVIINMNGDRQFRRNQLNKLNPLFPIHGLIHKTVGQYIFVA
jgi:hypothetical protein